MPALPTPSRLRQFATAGLLAGGLSSCVAGALPFVVVRGYLDHFAGDGSAEPYTPQLHQRLQMAAVLIAVVMCAGCSVVWRGSRSERKTGFENVADRSRIGSRQWRALLSGNWFAVIGLTVVALLVRLPVLQLPIRHDEAYSLITFAQYPWFVGVSVYSDPNNHVFHTLCLHISTRLFGEDLWAVRLPALIAGVLTVPATFLAARVTGGRAAGVLAGTLVATSSALIEYSVNARGYSMLCLWTALAMLAAALAQRNSRRVGRRGLEWELLAVSTAFGFWTVPVMLYPAVMIWVWTWWPCMNDRRLWWRGLRSAVAATLLTLILYSPVLIVSGWEAVVRNPYVRPLDWEQFIRELPARIGDAWQLLTRDVPWVAQLLVGTGITAAVFSSRPRQQGGRMVVAAGVGLCLLPLQRVLPPARVWLFLLPMAAALTAVGWSVLLSRRKRSERMAVTAVLLFLCGVGPWVEQVRQQSIPDSREQGAFSRAEQIINFVREQSTTMPRPLIVATAPAGAPLVYYARRRGSDLREFTRPTAETMASAIIVVDHTAGQTVERVLSELHLDTLADASRFEALQEFGGVVLYRLPPGQP